jgi:hypothetical protein
MDRDRSRRIVRKRREFCYYHRSLKSGVSDEENYKNRLQLLKQVNPAIDLDWYSFDLSLSVGFYLEVQYAEEKIVERNDRVINYLLESKPLLEDFDHELPDDQNLWKLMSIPNPSTDDYLRIYLNYGKLPFLTNNVSRTGSQILTQLLNTQETFNWYRSIIFDLNFREPAQLVMERENGKPIIDVVSCLFDLFGSYFVELFFCVDYETRTERSRIFVSDQRLPMKQMTLGFWSKEDALVPTGCFYGELCKLLIRLI